MHFACGFDKIPTYSYSNSMLSRYLVFSTIVWKSSCLKVVLFGDWASSAPGWPGWVGGRQGVCGCGGAHGNAQRRPAVPMRALEAPAADRSARSPRPDHPDPITQESARRCSWAPGGVRSIGRRARGARSGARAPRSVRRGGLTTGGMWGRGSVALRVRRAPPGGEAWRCGRAGALGASGCCRHGAGSRGPGAAWRIQDWVAPASCGDGG